jgi:hypothetical protein
MIQYLDGVDYPTALRLLGSETPLKSKSPAATLIIDPTEVDRVAAAMHMWDACVPLYGGTPAERYFEHHRGLDIGRLPFLMHHCLRWHDARQCVVALMTDPITTDPTGIHRTFLDNDGRKIERKMLGKQGVVRLSPDGAVTSGLGLTEGVEDGIAILLSGWAPIWAATSAGAIERFPVLAGVEALTVFSDADSVGMGAANKCVARYLEAGRQARVYPPPARLHAAA